MKLSEIKKILVTAEQLTFQLPNGNLVPEHFHITEIGLVTKHFIDCGGKERMEKFTNFQLWNANDVSHRLQPQKLINIIALAEQKLGMGDLEIEVEYQSDTIGKYGLAYNGNAFELVAKMTACLAQDDCGIPASKKPLVFSSLNNEKENCCTPRGGGC